MPEREARRRGVAASTAQRAAVEIDRLRVLSLERAARAEAVERVVACRRELERAGGSRRAPRRSASSPGAGRRARRARRRWAARRRAPPRTRPAPPRFWPCASLVCACSWWARAELRRRGQQPVVLDLREDAGRHAEVVERVGVPRLALQGRAEAVERGVEAAHRGVGAGGQDPRRDVARRSPSAAPRRAPSPARTPRGGRHARTRGDPARSVADGAPGAGQADGRTKQTRGNDGMQRGHRMASLAHPQRARQAQPRQMRL